MASEIVVEPITYAKESQPYNPPRYRLHGKQQPNLEERLPPALRVTPGWGGEHGGYGGGL